MPQNSAICVKVSAVFSISQTAVAFGIRGNVMKLSYRCVQIADPADRPAPVSNGTRCPIWALPADRVKSGDRSKKGPVARPFSVSRQIRRR